MPTLRRPAATTPAHCTPPTSRRRGAARHVLLVMTLASAVLIAACGGAKAPTTTEAGPARPYDLSTLGLPRFNAAPDLSNVLVSPPGYTFEDAPDEQKVYDDRLRKIPGLQGRITSTRIVTVAQGNDRIAAIVAFRFADSLDTAAVQDFIDGQLETAQGPAQIVALGSATGLQFITPDGVSIVFPVGKAVVLIVAQNPMALQNFARAYVGRITGS